MNSMRPKALRVWLILLDLLDPRDLRVVRLERDRPDRNDARLDGMVPASERRRLGRRRGVVTPGASIGSREASASG
jgi:hypothetical protein